VLNRAYHLYPRLWQSLAVAVAYFIAARICVYIADTGKAPAAIWVPGGIALAALIQFGPRVWPGVFLGSLAANMAVDLALPAGLALAFGNTIDPLVAVCGIRRYAGRQLDFGRTRHVLAYIAFGAIIGPCISGAFGTFGMQIGGVFSSPMDDLVGWFGWSLEGTLSVLIATSALLVLAQVRNWGWSSRRKQAEAVALLAILGLNGWLVLTGTRGAPLSEPYLVLPVMLWLVLRLGSPGAILGNLLLTVISAVAIVNRQGPFLLDTLTASMLWMQAFWSIASLATLLLAAALNEARAERYRQMFDGNQTIQLVLDATTGRVVDANPAACAFYGVPIAEIRKLSLEDLTAGERDIQVHCSPMQIDGRSLTYAIVHDISARRRAEDALRSSEERLQLVGRATKDTVWDWDLRTNEVWHNQGLSAVFGHPGQPGDYSAEWWLSQIHPQDRAAVTSAIGMAITRGAETWAHEYRFRRGDGSYAHVLARGYLSYENERAARMVGVLLDLSERKRIEEELAYRASHDALTGLANRYEIERTLTAAVETARAAGASLGLLIADLDHFKEVNDSLGHQVGDAVLQVVAERWRGVVREGDTLGRLAGDEFAVILPSADLQVSEGIAERLARALADPILLDGRSLQIGASVGVATSSGEADDVESLLRRADHAMYAIKHTRAIDRRAA
jgi:diguanylate cyclase (GGDEF)-like protein/PAS domain S-box-containing protein